MIRRFLMFFLCKKKSTLIIFPLGVAHVARLEEFLVHSQCAREGVRRMGSLAHFEVLAQHRTILGIYAIVDNLVSALNRALAAEVCDTMLGDYHLYGVLRVIQVRNHWNESGDGATLSG